MRRWLIWARNLAFRVDITEPAITDAEEYLRFLSETRKEPEADEFETEIRHLIYFSHRIIFGVEQARKGVTVFRIYHGARRKLPPESVD